MGVEVLVYALVSAAVSFAVTQLVDTSVDGGEDNGATVNKSGTAASRNPVYGTAITSAVPVWNNVANNNSAVLINVFACGIGVTAVRQVYIDDTEVLGSEAARRETPTGGYNQLRYSDSGLQNGFEKQCEVMVRAGLDTGIPMQLAIDYGDGEWTSAMRGDRVCCVAIKSNRIVDDEGIRIMSDSFKMNLLVDGLAVYDPRFHSAGEKEFTHSDPAVPSENRQCGRNPSIALMDYLTDSYYGMGLGFEYIDLNSFISAANWCDTHKIYIDGQIDNSSSFSNAIEAICKSGGLSVFVENGYIKVKYEDVEMPSHDFNADNIINGTFGVVEQSSSNYSNCIEVEYKDTQQNDEQNTFTLPANTLTDPTIIADGKLEVETLSMPMTRFSAGAINSASSSVKFFANRTLLKNKFQKQVEFDCDLLVNNVKIFEVITVTDENLNWDKKEFRVTSINKSVNAEKMNIATLNCVEYDPSVYSGTSNGGGGDTGKPVKPVIVSQPTNIVFKLHDLITTGSSTLSWSRTWFETSSQFDVEYRASNNANGWTTLGRTSSTEWKLPNLYPDTYDFRVRTWSNLYGSSNWTELLGQVVGQLGVFPSVTGLACDSVTRNFEWTWDDMLEQPVALPPDTAPSAPTSPIVRDYFSHYLIDILDGSTLLGSYQSSTNEYSYTFEQNTGKIRSLTGNVYIVSLDGTRSQLDTGSVLTATNAQCIAPAGVVDNTELSNTIITWDTVPEFDYRATRFYTSVTSGFTPDNTNLLKEQVGTLFSHIWGDSNTHFIRFAHADIFNNSSLVFSPEISVTPTGIDDLLPIDDRFDEIRDPLSVDRQSTVMKASEGDYVAGVGLFANEVGKTTDVLIAAEQLLMGVGGRPKYQAATAYVIGDKTLYEHTAGIVGLYQCKVDSTGNLPSDTNFWTVLQTNVNKAIFAVEEDGRVLIKNAVIEKLTSTNIEVESITGDSLAFNTVKGEKISSTTTITAGTGNNVGVLDGAHATARIYGGHADPALAPFRVDQNGKMTASNAEIKGNITASTIAIPNTTDPLFEVTAAGTATIKSALSGSRLVMEGDQLQVWDGSILRVLIGRLT